MMATPYDRSTIAGKALANFRKAEFEECIVHASMVPGPQSSLLRAESLLRLKRWDEVLQVLKDDSVYRLAPSGVKSRIHTLESRAHTYLRQADLSRASLDASRIEASHSENISVEASYLYAEVAFALSEGDLKSTQDYAFELLDLNPRSFLHCSISDLESVRQNRIRALLVLAYVDLLSGQIGRHIRRVETAFSEFQFLGETDFVLQAHLFGYAAYALRDFDHLDFEDRIRKMVDDDTAWAPSTMDARSEIYRSLGEFEARRGSFAVALADTSKSIDTTSSNNWKMTGNTKRAVLSRGLGEHYNEADALETAKRFATQASWSRIEDEKTPLAELAQEVSRLEPITAREIFAKFRQARSAGGRHGGNSAIDMRFRGHELIAEAIVLKNNGDPTAAIALLLEAFELWTSINYDHYAGQAALELAELNASPRFFEYARREAFKFPNSLYSRRCARSLNIA